jgi:uncharacterized protein with HEPN domain
MSNRDWRLLLNDILDCITKIEHYVHGMNYDTFIQDNKTIDAVVRNLEVIGEAARLVPVEIQTQYPNVPWAQIVGLRNRLIHGYFAIDEEIIWDIIINELPALHDILQQILHSENNDRTQQS